MSSMDLRDPRRQAAGTGDGHERFSMYVEDGRLTCRPDLRAPPRSPTVMPHTVMPHTVVPRPQPPRVNPGIRTTRHPPARPSLPGRPFRPAPRLRIGAARRPAGPESTRVAGDADPGSTQFDTDLDRSWMLPPGDLDTGSAPRSGPPPRRPASGAAVGDPLPRARASHRRPASRASRRTAIRVRSYRRAGDPPSRSPRRGDDRPPRPPHRARYLVAVLLVVALLGGGGFYLVRGSAPAAPAASGTTSARPAPASCGPAASAAGSAVSAALARSHGIRRADGTGRERRAVRRPPFGFVTASPSPPPSAHPRSSPAHSAGTPSPAARRRDVHPPPSLHRRHPGRLRPAPSSPSASASRRPARPAPRPAARPPRCSRSSTRPVRRRAWPR